MSDLSLIGIWLLVASVAVIVMEGLLAALWSVRLSRRAMVLSERLMAERLSLEVDVERLRMTLDETVELWRPYRRLLRLLQHPLAIALMQSYARRRMAAR
ncbi:MAG TPA: hypothetical protein VEN12_12695 [Verrucomicrobiae bacterium]|nr:hypothetical protein [Verrucomicrobiae bacterium]